MESIGTDCQDIIKEYKYQLDINDQKMKHKLIELKQKIIIAEHASKEFFTDKYMNYDILRKVSMDFRESINYPILCDQEEKKRVNGVYHNLLSNFEEVSKYLANLLIDYDILFDQYIREGH